MPTYDFTFSGQYSATEAGACPCGTFTASFDLQGALPYPTDPGTFENVPTSNGFLAVDGVPIVHNAAGNIGYNGDQAGATLWFGGWGVNVGDFGWGGAAGIGFQPNGTVLFHSDGENQCFAGWCNVHGTATQVPEPSVMGLFLLAGLLVAVRWPRRFPKMLRGLLGGLRREPSVLTLR